MLQALGADLFGLKSRWQNTCNKACFPCLSVYVKLFYCCFSSFTAVSCSLESVVPNLASRGSLSILDRVKPDLSEAG